MTREGFLGYKTHDCADRNLLGICTCELNLSCGDPGQCIGVGDWHDVPPAISLYPATVAPVACPGPFVHNPPKRRFDANIVHLFHRYQKESAFPFDFRADEFFNHTVPSGGSSSQAAVDTCAVGRDPIDGSLCAPDDGHGEIVGYLGASVPPPPIGVQMQNWPAREDAAARESLIKQIPGSPANWPHRPENPNLCLVSPGLIALVAGLDLPPHADAGPDQEMECEDVLTSVTLDGSMSSDPDDDELTFTWTGPFGTADGEIVTVDLPVGVHDVTLRVDDGRGRFDVDATKITITDSGAPELNVTLVPDHLWPPNHRLVEITAVIDASDCTGIESIELVSITSNEPDHGPGHGNTRNDIQGANLLTDDRSFYLRAERSGQGGGRIYTITYRAVDVTGLATETSAEVVVAHDQRPASADQKRTRGRR